MSADSKPLRRLRELKRPTYPWVVDLISQRSLHFVRCPECLSIIGIAVDITGKVESVAFDAYRPPTINPFGENGEFVPHACRRNHPIPDFGLT